MTPRSRRLRGVPYHSPEGHRLIQRGPLFHDEPEPPEPEEKPVRRPLPPEILRVIREWAPRSNGDRPF